MAWNLKFITKRDFREHVRNTIENYCRHMKAVDLKAFSRNRIDPIKLLFDKAVQGVNWETIIGNEIARQRDKSNNNVIGYFHQNMFAYIKGCKVPRYGREDKSDDRWDVICENQRGFRFDSLVVHTLYVEMKNKFNTMNSSSNERTCRKMRGRLGKEADCACLLVEAIAERSQNIRWDFNLDGAKNQNPLIRRVSMDKFYELVTGDADAFHKICVALPTVIDEVVNVERSAATPNDTVMRELRELANGGDDWSLTLALYMLGFGTYEGFAK